MKNQGTYREIDQVYETRINRHDKADKEYYINANTILNIAQRAGSF